MFMNALRKALPIARKVRWRAVILGLKLLVTICSIIFLLLYVDRNAVLDRLRHISLPYVILALTLGLAQIVIVGYRWSILAHFFSASESDSNAPSMRQCQLINYASQFVGQMLPFLAADALRIVYARASGTSLKASFLSVVFDRGIALLVLVGFCVVALFVSPWIGNVPGLRLMVATLAGLALFGSALALLSGEALASFLAENQILWTVSELLRSFRRLFLRWKVIVPVLLLALCVHGISIAIFWLLCLGQRLSVSIIDMFAIVPFLLIGAAIPISVAGWGVREGLAVALLTGIGISADGALAGSLSFGAVSLLGALPGAATILMLPTRIEHNGVNSGAKRFQR